MNYKKTLNLPSTKFPMKANLSQREPEQLAAWEASHLYENVRKQSADKERFILHDGPPYANGHIHTGTALNKILKDIIVRSRQMTGYDAVYVPGWDCHGLPIEHKVDIALKGKKKEMTQTQIRKRCRTYAEKYIDIQRKEFKRLGVMGEWDRPYLTMNYPYEATIARECCKFAMEGSLYRSKKPIYWCCSCQTALAEAEIEYHDETSPSIYVKFALLDDLGARIPALAGKQVYVIIWTTTPWTLPANLAIALNPQFVYAAVEIPGQEVFILARDLVDDCMGTFGIENYTVLAEIEAGTLEEMNCQHPLYDRQSLIVLADHVTLEAGTGCVHTAPGHGREDYEVGIAYGIDIYSPVDNEGRFTNDVDFFSGQFVFDANKNVNAKLQEVDRLVKEEDLTHAYPHCWRCRQPVIFRATPQWFISMDKTGLRQKSLAEIEKVKWIPHWGKERIYGMIKNRPDWCISRQRAWGVPITVLYCEKCDSPYMTEALMERIHTLFTENGADIWFEKSVEDLLQGHPSCPHCGHDTFIKENDILDVWFDSGVSHAAVLEYRDDLSWPADLYLEGSDQHRGWFHSALLTAVALRGQAPYRAVLTHGFVVDADGKKMSKSIGNIIAPSKLIKQYGAEILRLWVTATDYRDDIRISDSILKQLTDAYRKIRNTCRFILGNCSDFNPESDAVAYDQLPELDRYALHTLYQLVEKARKAYKDYEFHGVYHGLYNYCTVDLSSFYLDILKDRLYTSLPMSMERRSAQTVLHTILDAMVRIMAPIMIFTAEEIRRYLPARTETADSVHLELFPVVAPQWNDPDLANRWQQILAVREEVTKALEAARVAKKIGHPLSARVVISAPETIYRELLPYADDLKTVFITSQAELRLDSMLADAYVSENIDGLTIQVDPAEGEKCERCWIHDPSVGSHPVHRTLCRRCSDVIENLPD